MTAKRVLILYGGRSAEHEISILSANFVRRSLQDERYQPLLVGIDRDGHWHHQTEAQLPVSADPRDVAIDRDGPCAHILPMPVAGERAGTLHVAGGERIPFDVAFPVLHGPLGEDGCVQGLFELADIPYVGAGVTGSAVGMDKVIQKQVFESVALPVLPFVSLRRERWDGDRDGCLEQCARLGYPVFVKPVNMGSSVGIGRASHHAEVVAAVDRAFELDGKVVVERGLERPREIECAVLGNHDPRASLPGEINVHHPDGWYSYAAKYIDDGAELCVPARLNETQTAAVQLLAIRAFRALDLRGMARVDMFLTEDDALYLNEVNTIPGFTAISMFPRMWQASDLTGEDLVSELLNLALDRHRVRRRLRTHR